MTSAIDSFFGLFPPNDPSSDQSANASFSASLNPVPLSNITDADEEIVGPDKLSEWIHQSISTSVTSSTIAAPQHSFLNATSSSDFTPASGPQSRTKLFLDVHPDLTPSASMTHDSQRALSPHSQALIDHMLGFPPKSSEFPQLDEVDIARFAQSREAQLSETLSSSSNPPPTQSLDLPRAKRSRLTSKLPPSPSDKPIEFVLSIQFSRTRMATPDLRREYIDKWDISYREMRVRLCCKKTNGEAKTLGRDTISPDKECSAAKATTYTYKKELSIPNDPNLNLETLALEFEGDTKSGETIEQNLPLFETLNASNTAILWLIKERGFSLPLPEHNLPKIRLSQIRFPVAPRSSIHKRVVAPIRTVGYTITLSEYPLQESVALLVNSLSKRLLNRAALDFLNPSYKS